MKDKAFWLSADQIVPDLARNEACIASDRITVDGRPVGFMFRDYSGWNFFAGDESQEYVDDAGNLGLYSLNTIANYDRTILPHLDARHGTVWVNDEEPRARLAKVLQGTSPAGYDRKNWSTGNVLFHSYRLDEQSAEQLARSIQMN